MAAALCLGGPTAASAAQRPAGSVLAWGWNTYGQLWDGTTTDSSTPVPVDLPPGTHVTAISAGGYHSLALTSAGSVLAWGYNEFGALGDGTTTNSSTPIPVHLPAGTHVTAVSVGYQDSLALTSDGSVLSWGNNELGALGDGTTTNRLTPVPVDLPAGTRVTAVAAGVDDSLTLTSDGSVLAWGENGDGELGDGTTTNRLTPVPVDLPAGTRVTAVAADGAQSLALTSDGRVLAWGNTTPGSWGTAPPPTVSRRSRWTCPRAPASPPSPPASAQTTTTWRWPTPAHTPEAPLTG